MYYGIRLFIIFVLILFSNLLFSSPLMAAEIDIFNAAHEGDVSSITEYVRQGGNLNISNSRGKPHLFWPPIMAMTKLRLH